MHHQDSEAHLLLDWSTTIKAANGELLLAGDPEHAGFQYRPHNDVAKNKSSKYTFHAEGINPKKDLDLPWVGLTYELGGKKYTVQHMNHPDNPKGTKYSAYRDYGRFGAYPTTTVKDGKTLTLKYRIRVQLGDMASREQFDIQYKKFLKQVPAKQAAADKPTVVVDAKTKTDEKSSAR